MAKQYVLLKLPLETVRDLKRRQNQLGKPSIDQLLVDMIHILDNRNAALKCTGWQDTRGAVGG